MTNKNKELKIRDLLVKYANNLIFHRHEYFELEKQLLDFPKGAHDDIIDSLAMVYEIHRPIEESGHMLMWLQTEVDYYGNTIYR